MNLTLEEIERIDKIQTKLDNLYSDLLFSDSRNQDEVRDEIRATLIKLYKD